MIQKTQNFYPLCQRSFKSAVDAMTGKLQFISVLDRKPLTFISRPSQLWLVGRQLVVTAGLPPIRQICGAWQPPPSVPNRHIRSLRSLRGMGLDCQISLRCSSASSCLVFKSPPTHSQTTDGDAGSLELAGYLRRVRRAVCLLLWEGEKTLSEEVSDADRAGAASSARIVGCQQGGARSAQ